MIVIFEIFLIETEILVNSKHLNKAINVFRVNCLKTYEILMHFLLIFFIYLLNY